jgi:hypothetical protein
MFRRKVRAADHFVAWLALLGPDQAWYKANNILPTEEGGEPRARSLLRTALIPPRSADRGARIDGAALRCCIEGRWLNRASAERCILGGCEGPPARALR